MSGMFDDMMMGARAAKATFKGIKKAVELTSKAVKSETFQRATSEIKERTSDAAYQVDNMIQKVIQHIEDGDREYYAELARYDQMEAEMCKTAGVSRDQTLFERLEEWEKVDEEERLKEEERQREDDEFWFHYFQEDQN